jgi:hypothetical protein
MCKLPIKVYERGAVLVVLARVRVQGGPGLPQQSVPLTHYLCSAGPVDVHSLAVGGCGALSCRVRSAIEIRAFKLIN